MTDIEREAIFPLLDDRGANFLFEVYNNSLFNTPKNINSRKVKLLQKNSTPLEKNINSQYRQKIVQNQK